MIPEKKIEEYLRTEVIKRGGRAIKLTSSSLRALPDRLVLLPRGVMAFVEVKAPNRKPSINQTMMMRELRRLGFIAVWINSRPRVDAFLKHICA